MKLVYTTDEVTIAAAALKRQLLLTRICGLQGTLGAGKTTLVQALLRSVGVTGPIQSPTFSYVVSYAAPDGSRWHHFDLYRIHDEATFREMGFVEYLEDVEARCIIEWPEHIIKLLQLYPVCLADIQYESEDSRVLTLYANGSVDVHAP